MARGRLHTREGHATKRFIYADAGARGVAGNERHLLIECEYDRRHVTADMEAAIERIFRDAAVRLTAKIALVARPDNIKMNAQSFKDNRYRSLLDGDDGQVSDGQP